MSLPIPADSTPSISVCQAAELIFSRRTGYAEACSDVHVSYMAFREFLRRRIETLAPGVAMSTVSANVGRSKNALGSLLNPRKRSVLDVVDLIAKALNVTLEDLLCDSTQGPASVATDKHFQRIHRWWHSLDTEDRRQIADFTMRLAQRAIEQDQSQPPSTTKGDRSVGRPPKEAQRRR